MAPTGDTRVPWPHLLGLGTGWVGRSRRVSDLLNEEGDAWDKAKLVTMFSPDDIQDILQICVGGQGSVDFLLGTL